MEENTAKKTSDKSTEASGEHHHHHHHHHHDSEHHHHHHSGKHKDATGEFRKRMFHHVERMRLLRKWGFTILCVIAAIISFIVILLYTLD